MKRISAAPAARLGMTRAVIGGYTLYYLGKRRKMLRKLHRGSPDMFAPVGPVRVLNRPLPPKVADTLADATLASTALFAVGAGHPVVGRLHSALLTWTLSYRNSWSMIYHNDNTLVMHSMVLGAARSADGFSVDALVSRARSAPPPAPHPRYAWPMELMNAASAVTYLLAGIAKVKGPSGWAWAKGDAMRRQVAVDSVRKEVFGSTAAPAGYALYKHRHLFTGFAVGSLAVELGAPLALLDRRAGRVWAVSAFGMHWGIRLIMSIKFRYQMSGVSFVSWFEPERLLRIGRRG